MFQIFCICFDVKQVSNFHVNHMMLRTYLHTYEQSFLESNLSLIPIKTNNIYLDNL